MTVWQSVRGLLLNSLELKDFPKLEGKTSVGTIRPAIDQRGREAIDTWDVLRD
jgi:hypothetical protein